MTKHNNFEKNKNCRYIMPSSRKTLKYEYCRNIANNDDDMRRILETDLRLVFC